MRKSRQSRELDADRTVEGDLERDLPIDQWLIPGQIDIEKDMLRWALYGKSGSLPRIQPAGNQYFEDFLALERGTPDQILAYAKKWGLLLLCKSHKLPSSHRSTKQADLRTAYFGRCELDWTRLGKQTWYREPLWKWNQWAARTNAVIRLAQNLHAGELGAKQDWGRLYPSSNQDTWWEDREKDYRTKITEGRLFLCHKVSSWLRIARVELTPYWGEKNPTILFGNRTLFGALALQLLFVVTGSTGFAICSACGQTYLPSRRPRINQRHYCQACRTRGHPQADASRDLYWRRKLAST